MSAIGEHLLDRVRAHARARPGHPALIDARSGAVVRYDELEARVGAVARLLLEDGCRPGDGTVLMAQRSPALVLGLLAASAVGAPAFAAVSPRAPRALLDLARSRLPIRRVLHDGAHAHLAADGLLGERWIALPPWREGAAETTALSRNPVLYFDSTSGSTNASRIHAATHDGVVSNALACAEAFGLDAGSRIASCFRHHAHELFARALALGATAVLLPDAEDPFAVCEALERWNVSWLMASPTALAALDAAVTTRRGMPGLRGVESGGAPLSPALRRRLEWKLDAPVLPVFGCSEARGVVLAPARGKGRGAASSVGRPVPGYTVEVLDPSTGNSAARGAWGELVIRGSAVIDGYVGGDPTGGGRVRDGVFRTGDLARQHRDGTFTVRGRLDGRIKVGGESISSEAVETALVGTGLVREAAVVAVRDELLGNAPAALVVPAPGASSLDIAAACARALKDPLLELPRELVFVETLPRTPAGKVDRTAARTLFRETRDRRVRVPLTHWRVLAAVAPKVRGWGATWRLALRPTTLWRLLSAAVGQRRGGP